MRRWPARLPTALALSALLGALLACSGAFTHELLAEALAEIDDPGSPSWEQGVRELVVFTYDLDSSGRIDTPAEVRALPCRVLASLSEQAAQAPDGDLRTTYLNPAQWRGESLGLSGTIAPDLLHALDACPGVP